VSEEEELNLVIRRILVALDESPHSEAALEAAVNLAARFRAELLGIFVEDVNLLRIAQLPFTREVGLFSATRREITTQEIERQLRVQAQRMRRLFSGMAERRAVQGEFYVARGAITPELMRAASDADILILGKTGCSPSSQRQIGSTTRAVVFGAPSLTLILRDGMCLGLPVLVIYDGSELSEKGLTAAAVLSQREDQPLAVFVLAGEEERAGRLQTQAANRLSALDVTATFYILSSAAIPKLSQMILMAGCGTLVLPATCSHWKEEALLRLVDDVEVPVLIVR
jgi:nucleotide-binding universal stress UspA family protein